MARPKNPIRGVPARQKHWFFIGECKKAHHAAARARFSKSAQRSSESSILTAQDGAHDLPNEENEHRADAGASFSNEMCTALKREHHFAHPARHQDPPGGQMALYFAGRHVRETHRASTGEP